jgi:RsiW-degrading membrane proteinase PrsW (M82 family)
LNLVPDLIDRTINALERTFNIFDSGHLIFVGLSLVPILIWLYIFFRHQRENKLLTVITFLGGMLAVVPIFVLEVEILRIENWLIGTTSILLFGILFKNLWVGVYEEVAKHWIVKAVDRKLFRNIDDAIQLSIVAALGFAFLENTKYFYDIWNSSNPEIAADFWFVCIFRSIGSVFLHVLASGVFGYYYGLAHFAKPVLRDKLAQGKKFIFTKKMHRILHFKSETVFREEKILEGLIFAAGLHGLFDLMAEMSQHYADTGSLFWSKIWLAGSIPLLMGGYFWLINLLDKKENHKIYGEVEERDVLG